MSNQQKSYYEKKDNLLQKQINRYINFKELLNSYVELQKRLKEMEKNS